MATAYEGTEGITNASVASFQAHYPPGGTPSTTTFINSSGNPTNSYATNRDRLRPGPGPRHEPEPGGG